MEEADSTKSKALALDRLSDWKEKGATLLFTFTAPKSRFSIHVLVLHVSDSQISFQWILNATDARGTFVMTNGYYTLLLAHASLTVSDDPEPLVSISHGDFRCVLTVIRPTAF
jgi:hypothetical protein